ncbi:MAG: peroxiredoxin-like family protein [Caldilineaceae bacterium]
MPLHAELDAMGVNIVAISFGIAYWARMWLQETNAPFPILLDPEQTAYTAYGLERSFWRSWGPRTLLYYAKAILRGQKLLGNRGDSEQLGGNFIVDANGIVRFAYASREPTDRPSIDTLMSALRRLK